MADLPKGKIKVMSVFTIAILIAAGAAIQFSSHPVLWVVGLLCTIPIFAAIVGGWPE